MKTKKIEYITKVRELLQYASNNGYNRMVNMYNSVIDDEILNDNNVYMMNLDTSNIKELKDTTVYTVNLTETLFDHTFIETFTKGNVSEISINTLKDVYHLCNSKQEHLNSPERRMVIMQLSLFTNIEDRIDYIYDRFIYQIDQYFGRKKKDKHYKNKPVNNVWEGIKNLLKR